MKVDEGTVGRMTMLHVVHLQPRHRHTEATPCVLGEAQLVCARPRKIGALQSEHATACARMRCCVRQPRFAYTSARSAMHGAD